MSRLRPSLPARRNMNEFAMRCTPNEPRPLHVITINGTIAIEPILSRGCEIEVYIRAARVISRLRQTLENGWMIINVNYRFPFKTNQNNKYF